LVPDALSLTNVHAFYGDSHILHGVSFSLQQGGVLALLDARGRKDHLHLYDHRLFEAAEWRHQAVRKAPSED